MQFHKSVLVGYSGIALACGAGLLGCGSNGVADEQVATKAAALTGTIVIAGQVSNANGLGLPGVTVTLSGSVVRTAQTDANGNYAFNQLNAGSYSVRPTMNGCSFGPDLVNLNNLNTNITEDFGGSGASCGGAQTVNSGAVSGPLTISGRLRDASGRAVVGARINLGGPAQAVRFSDFSGGYVFHVSPGTYSLSAGGDCGFNPGNVNLTNLSANVVENFSSATAACVTAASSSLIGTGEVLTVSQNGIFLGTTYVHVEQLASASQAQARLQLISAEQGAPSRGFTVGGSPGIERQLVTTLADIELPGSGEEQHVTSVTSAIAVGATIVRFESQLLDDASTATVTRFLSAGRNLAPEDLTALHGLVPVAGTSVRLQPLSPPAFVNVAAPGSPGQIFGEVAVAASDTSPAVVIASASGAFFSTDGAKTATKSQFQTVPAPPAATFVSLGDQSVALGAPDESGRQAFYYTQIVRAIAGTATALPATAIALFKSSDDGRSFAPVSTAAAYIVDCATAGSSTPGSNCIVTDQAQLAVDRHLRATGAAGRSFDQLYVAWDNVVLNSAGKLGMAPAVACSKDGGTTWQYDYTTLAKTRGSFPRVSVGPDGSFLVAYAAGDQSDSTGKRVTLSLQTFSSCSANFQPQTTSNPTITAKVTNPDNMAGLDRQPAVNYSVAADEATTSGGLLFFAYTNRASAGNDDIHVAKSFDGGRSWSGDSIVNSTGTGDRFFPSICSTGSTAFVTWFDRRAGVGAGASPDRTAFFRSSLLNDGSTVGTEFNVSGAGSEDPECLSGFPSNSDSAQGEGLCTDLPNSPINAGQCSITVATRCDFRSSIPSACPAGETCQVVSTNGINPGIPKFGDYVEPGCARGGVFMAWSAGTPPAGACGTNGTQCTSNAACCSGQCTAGGCKPTASSTCTADTGACATNGNCCSGTCEGGTCLAAVGLYSASTSCTGPDCTPTPPPVKPVISSFAGAPALVGFGPAICLKGSGFTANGEVDITYFGIPVTGASTQLTAIADSAGNFQKFDNEASTVNTNCSSAQAFGNVTVTIVDKTTSAVATDSFHASDWCSNFIQVDEGDFTACQ